MSTSGQQRSGWVAARGIAVTVAVGAVVGCLAAGAGISAIGSVPVVLAVVGIGAGLIPVALLWQGSNGVVRGFAVGFGRRLGRRDRPGWLVLQRRAVEPGPRADRGQASAACSQHGYADLLPRIVVPRRGSRIRGGAVGQWEVVGDDTLDPGQGLLLVYGEKCSQRTCAAKIALSIEPWASDLTHGSRQLGSLRGVPAVSTSEAVILVSGDILVRVGGGPGATELAGDAAKALRLVGEAEAAERDLPPPSETLARRLASLC